METRCVARYLRVAPRKMRLVADIVRGKTVNEAIALLKFTPKSGALPTLKAIQSAVANLVNRDDARDVNPDALVVKTIFVDEGPSYRRYLPRAMGRATPIRKRMSHLTVAVALPAAPVDEEPSAAEEPPVSAKKSPKEPPKKSGAKRTTKKKSD